MTTKDLPSLRTLAANGQIIYTKHALKRLLDRGYTTSDVDTILSSPTNQIIECQSPSMTPGKEHTDERILISDPTFQPDTIILTAISYSPLPEIIIISVEHALDSVWEKDSAKNPWLVRR